MLLEKLEQEGIKKELEALGYNCEEIFGGLKEETDRLYASYSWQKIPCTVEGIREYVIHAVPPKEIREKDAEIDRQSKIAGVFCKAYEKAVLLTPTEENVRIWVKCTRMTREEMEDTIKESRELAGVFTSIAGLMEHLLPERGTL